MTLGALHLLGGGLLALAGALLGGEKLAEQERRRRCLRTLAQALGRLERELETLQNPLGELFARLTDCPFFYLVSAGFGTQPLEQLWQSAAAVQPLAEAERTALASLGSVLGRCAAAKQSAEIAMVRSSLTDAAEALEREIAERGRRLPVLGAALGAIVAAVLF